MAEEVKAGIDIERVVDKYIPCLKRKSTREFRQYFIYGIRNMTEKAGLRQMKSVIEKEEQEKVREERMRKFTEFLKQEGKFFKL